MYVGSSIFINTVLPILYALIHCYTVFINKKSKV